MTLVIPTIPNTKRSAAVQSKKPDSHERISKVLLPVPDDVVDVQKWLDRVYGNYSLIEVR